MRGYRIDGDAEVMLLIQETTGLRKKRFLEDKRYLGGEDVELMCMIFIQWFLPISGSVLLLPRDLGSCEALIDKTLLNWSNRDDSSRIYRRVEGDIRHGVYLRR